jgi:hypothetical protein
LENAIFPFEYFLKRIIYFLYFFLNLTYTLNITDKQNTNATEWPNPKLSQLLDLKFIRWSLLSLTAA